MRKQLASFILEIVEVVLIATAIVLPIRLFLVQPFFVKGESMRPNYVEGDYLVVDELTYKFREPQRGEVLVFKFPLDPSEFFIKRLIGVPGDTIEIKTGSVFVKLKNTSDFIQLEEEYLPSNQITSGNIRIALGPNEYFVLGDNRVASYDSRSWGPLKKADIIGRAWVRAWPMAKFMVSSLPSYNFN